MPKLEDGETAVIGHFGIEVDDLEDTKAELTRRGVVLQGEVETDEGHFIFTAPHTTFAVTLQLMEHKGRGTGAWAPTDLTPALSTTMIVIRRIGSTLERLLSDNGGAIVPSTPDG